VLVEHRQLSNYVSAVQERLRLAPGESFATVSTFAADLGHTSIFPALTMGGCLHIITQERASDPDALAEYFGRQRVDVLKIVPSHLEALLTSAAPERVLPRRRLVLGGEASRWELYERVHGLSTRPRSL
jgi:non-ribosomal peptide synthetase component F